MSFTQSCFIRKNTPELKKKLEELGYKMNLIYSPNEHNLYIGSGVYSSANFIDNYYLDCGTNEELFLALAALRDDTNANQWFIAQNTMWDENYNGEITVYYEEGEWLIWDYYFYMEDMPPHVRKATVEEIIEHFNKN